MDRIKFKNDSKYKGIVERVFVEDNQRVSEGQSLAVITTQVEKFEIVSHMNGLIKNVYISEKLIISHGDAIFDIYTEKDIEKLVRKNKIKEENEITQRLDSEVANDTETMRVKVEENSEKDIDLSNWFRIEDTLNNELKSNLLNEVKEETFNSNDSNKNIQSIESADEPIQEISSIDLNDKNIIDTMKFENITETIDFSDQFESNNIQNNDLIVDSVFEESSEIIKEPIISLGSDNNDYDIEKSVDLFEENQSLGLEQLEDYETVDDFDINKTTTIDLDSPLEVAVENKSSDDLMYEIAVLTRQISKDVKDDLHLFKQNLDSLDLKYNSINDNFGTYMSQNDKKLIELAEIINTKFSEGQSVQSSINTTEIIDSVKSQLLDFINEKDKSSNSEFNLKFEEIRKLIEENNSKLEKIKDFPQIKLNDNKRIIKLDFDFNLVNLSNTYKELKDNIIDENSNLYLTSFFILALHKVILNSSNINKLYKNKLGVLFNKQKTVSTILKLNNENLYQINEKLAIVNNTVNLLDQTFILNDLSISGISKASFDLLGKQLMSISIGSLSKVGHKNINISITFDSNLIKLNDAINLIKDFHSILENPEFLI